MNDAIIINKMSSKSHSSPIESFGSETEVKYNDIQHDHNDTNLINNDKSPTCYVLNLVFDYILRPPCPLEKLECKHYEKEQDRENDNLGLSSDTSNDTEEIQVPVIRIFGPLFKNTESKKSQSSCIYIHNAFPYIIARPRRECFFDNMEGGWWSENEKELTPFLPIIHVSLEEMMKSSMALSAKDHGTRKYIRKVSIVEGREFYSYSPW